MLQDELVNIIAMKNNFYSTLTFDEIVPEFSSVKAWSVNLMCIIV